MVAAVLAHNHVVHGGDAFWIINSVANLVIVAGYLIVPFTVLRELPLTVSVKLAGALFFITCAITHASMAFNFQHRNLMVSNHIVQAMAVLWFVLGFYRLLRRANHVRDGDTWQRRPTRWEEPE